MITCSILWLYLYSYCNIYPSKIHLLFSFFTDTISLARAEDDYNAPDCRFINIKKGQLIYVYSKLVKEKGAGEFWAGSVRFFCIKVLIYLWVACSVCVCGLFLFLHFVLLSFIK